MQRDMKQFFDQMRLQNSKKPLPILSFPSVSLMGVTVREMTSLPGLQSKGMKLVAEAVDAAACVSMMDLSVEAEAFGAQIRRSEDEVPTVVGALVEDEEQAEALQIPAVGAGRTGLYVEEIRKACELITDRPVLAGVIGPFSLAGRLMDVTEIMVACYTQPDAVHTVMKKACAFLKEYMLAYREAGANGVVIAEPLTGMLSPALAEEFSEPYVRELIASVRDDHFAVVYHNCGNNVADMAASIFRVGADAYHFGNAVDMRRILPLADPNTLIMGNVDPAGQFLNGTPESIREETLKLMEDCCPLYPNFVISSGCDIPPAAKWENIHAFFAAAEEYYRR
ncbi:MAG: uroporphyrinogen decarboxylase family protein [Clostridia bacterium]|nr:uroporphyrinogen decarboxylase family protein [Clostridia bacterium]